MFKVIISSTHGLLVNAVRAQERRRSLLYLRCMWRPAWETLHTILRIPSGKLSLLELVPTKGLTDIDILALLKSIHGIMGIVAEVERTEVVDPSSLIARDPEGLLDLLLPPRNGVPGRAHNRQLINGGVLDLLIRPIVPEDSTPILPRI